MILIVYDIDIDSLCIKSIYFCFVLKVICGLWVLWVFRVIDLILDF